MRKILVIIVVAVLLHSTDLFAYQMTTMDERCYVFGPDGIKEDSSRYLAVYEVDEANMTISLVEETDLRTGERWTGDTVFQIVGQPTVFKAGDALKGLRFNPKRANIETISFCEGKYVYSKTTEKYINLFSGKYTTNFNDK